MFKPRLTAVITSLVVAALGAGCSSASSSADDSSSSSVANLESAAPKARFAKYMKTLKDTLQSGRSKREIAEALLDSGRPAAFSLQALCRLYADADPKFEDMRDDFKDLEDGIGEYDKWHSIYQQAVSEHRDDATLDRLKKQSDKALSRFTDMLGDRDWITSHGDKTRLEKMDKFLDDFDWGSRSSDRKRVLKRMIKELEDIDDTKYDMSILEHGNGVHELRRDIRWVLIEQLAVNGMITLRNDCPIPAYASVPNDNRYGALRPSASEPAPCQVSQCLVFAAAKAVEDLGEIKDKAEAEVNIADADDVVPKRLRAPAEAIYHEIRQSDLIKTYVDQLKSCKDAQ